MLFDHTRGFPRTSRARRTGLICLPGPRSVDLNIDLDIEHPEVNLYSIGEWLAMPPEQQAPREALAMYEVAGGKVRIALIDAQTRSLHAMIHGPEEGLGQFKTALEKRSGRMDDQLAAEAVSGTLVAEIKSPSPEPPPGPKVDETETTPESAPITRVA